VKRYTIITLAVFLILLSGSYPVFAKPIPIRNQMPLYLFYLQMVPESAPVAEQNKFEIDADYTVSNITVSCFTPVSSLYNINIDAEISRITLDLRYGLYEDLEIGLEVPYISLSRGYLDEFVEDFEDTVGARTPRSRERQGSRKLNYSFIYNSQSLINKIHSSEGLGDVALKAKYQLIKEEALYWQPNLSLRTALKFPTANDKDLLGSGEFDFGFGIIADKLFFKKMCIYSGLNLVLIQKPGFFSILNMQKEIISGMAAIEYFFTDRFSVVTQITGSSTPYPYSETNALDNKAFEFGLGINYTWKEKRNVSWRFGFTENIYSASTPDVSFDTGFKIGF